MDTSKIRERLQDNYDQELLFADEWDDCIIGISDDFGDIRVVYSVDKMIEQLMSYGDTYLEAREYIEYNTLNAWVGDRTPIYMETNNVL
tara:strand:+ start:37 stop:303 length:267 start_codon:yes stop_codon:yes gene_type:complete